MPRARRCRGSSTSLSRLPASNCIGVVVRRISRNFADVGPRCAAAFCPRCGASGKTLSSNVSKFCVFKPLQAIVVDRADLSTGALQAGAGLVHRFADMPRVLAELGSGTPAANNSRAQAAFSPMRRTQVRRSSRSILILHGLRKSVAACSGDANAPPHAGKQQLLPCGQQCRNRRASPLRASSRRCLSVSLRLLARWASKSLKAPRASHFRG